MHDAPAVLGDLWVDQLLAKLAQPLVRAKTSERASAGTVARAIVVDTSASMQRTAADGTRAIDVARLRARQTADSSRTSTILETASHAKDHVRDTAQSARGTFVDLGIQALKALNTIRSEEHRLVGSALERAGLQRRQSALRPALWFVVGAVLVGSVVLFFVPMFGKVLRSKIRGRMGKAEDAGADLAKSVAADVVKSVEKRVAAVAGTVDGKSEAGSSPNGRDPAATVWRRS